MGIRLEWQDSTEALVFRIGATERIGWVTEGDDLPWVGVLDLRGVCAHTTPELAAWGIVDELRRLEAEACKISTR